MDRIAELIDKIKYHNKKYWIDNNPEIPDQEYDKLVNELYTLDYQNPELYTIYSPINNSRGEVIHETPMLSLNRAYDLNTLYEKLRKMSRTDGEVFTIQLKYDGISADWSPRNNSFNRSLLSTRGTKGNNGKDITDKVPYIVSLEFNLPLYNVPTRQRGEIVMLKSIFNKYKNTDLLKTKIEGNYKNTRSAVVGLISRDDLTIEHIGLLHFIKFEHYQYNIELNNIYNIDWDIFVKQLNNYDYPLDGIVFKLADLTYAKSLGNTSHHPRSAVAYKYTSLTGVSKLIDIEWNVSRDSINPVGIILPIDLGGHTNTRVNLHNIMFIRNNDICVGDTIEIEKTGEIISQFKNVIKKGTTRLEIILEKCPSCGSDTHIQSTQYVCTNPYCSANIVSQLENSIKKLEIKKLGKSTITKLHDTLNCTNIINILELDKQQLSIIPEFKQKTIDNIYNSIQHRINTPIEKWRLLASLNIPSISDGMCKTLATVFNIDDLLSMDTQTLSKFSGISEKRANILVTFFTNNIEIIHKLLSKLTIQ